MSLKVAIAGGGIGGLAAAVAAASAGCVVQVFEKTAAPSEAGAGIQLGPNVTRILQRWGLADALRTAACAPERLQVRSAESGKLLGELRLGDAMAQRYGAPYLTLHRADLHAVLLAAARNMQIEWQLGSAVQSFHQMPQSVVAQAGNVTHEADMLVGADGLWSRTRQHLLNDGPPNRYGHLAYRALINQSNLLEKLRSQNVTAWLGSKMHTVQYPVRQAGKGGEWLNVVAFVHGDAPDDFQNWDHSANAADLTRHMAGCCPALQDVLQAATNWRLWVMHDRPALESAHQMAQGRVALLGDAAHPMRPYLAQGAGMAIEDAAELGLVLKETTAQTAPDALQRYAAARWQRNSRVQARALRNGLIFHAQGPMRWGRDAAMKVMGEKLLDMPWLYGFTR